MCYGESVRISNVRQRLCSEGSREPQKGLKPRGVCLILHFFHSFLHSFTLSVNRLFTEHLYWKVILRQRRMNGGAGLVQRDK